MAKTNRIEKKHRVVKSKDGKVYEYDEYRTEIVIGHKLNDNGIEIPVRKTFRAKTQRELREKIDAFTTKKNAGLETRTQYFGVLADSWISEFFIHDGTLKDSSKHRYISAWNRTIKPLEFYHLPLQDITAKTIQTAYNDLIASGTKISELKQVNKLMVRFYKYLEIEGLGRNFTSSLTLPKEKVNGADEKISVWTDDEIKKILGGLDNADNRFRLRFLIVLAYYTGGRKSELLSLKYDDITPDGVRITKTLAEVSDGFENGKIKTRLSVTDPKTRKSVRTIPVDPVVYEELKRHKEWHKREQIRKGYRSDFIFTTDSGEFYNNKNLDVALSRYYKKIGVEFKTMHTYRHTYATLLCKAGYPIETARELLGHESIETTARFYVAVSEDSKREAALSLRQFAVG